MEGVLKDIPGVVVYLDDILITGRTNTDHLKSLQEKTITAGEGRIKKKCSFMGSSVDYLGYQIDKEGLHPLGDKVKALKKAPQPRNQILFGIADILWEVLIPPTLSFGPLV